MLLARVCTWGYSQIGKLVRHLFTLILLTMPRDEVGPWVLGVSGSLFRKARSWDEARDLYNARLASGTVQILS